MSPSWTKWACPGMDCQVGMVLGQNELTVVAVQGKGAGSRKMPVLQRIPLAVPLFESECTPAAEEALVQALTTLNAPFRHRYAAVHVAVPDPVLRSSVFELEDWPAKKSWQQALIRLRLTQEWQRGEDSLECQGQHLGRVGERHLLWGQGGDRSWLACVRRALTRAEISPWSLNAAAVYRFNGLPPTLTSTPGALLSVDPDAWTLLMWDEQARVRQVLTRLRRKPSAGEPLSAIADEAERAVLAYVRGAGRSVERMHLCGEHESVSTLIPELNARLREPVQLWSPMTAAGLGAGVSLREGWAPLARVVAMHGSHEELPQGKGAR